MDVHQQIYLPQEIIKEVKSNFFEYIYQGEVTDEITRRILELLENKLMNNVPRKVIRKRIFYVLVECLQNVVRHQDHHRNEKYNDKDLVVIQRKENAFSITTANVLHNERISTIRQQVDYIHQLDEKGLEEAYQNQLLHGDVSNRGGAGLGLLSMARKASRFVYSFAPIDAEFSYFYFRTIIPYTRDTDFDFVAELENLDLTKTVNLHKQMTGSNVILNFNGDFDHSNIENFLPIVEEQVKTEHSEQSYQLVFVMNKMLLNIVRYASFFEYDGNFLQERPGVFLLGFSKGRYVLTAGNYLPAKYKEILEKKISFVNRLSHEMLEDFNEYLSSFFEADEINKPDSSIIQMRLVGKTKLDYIFTPVNSDTYFFTLQTYI